MLLFPGVIWGNVLEGDAKPGAKTNGDEAQSKSEKNPPNPDLPASNLPKEGHALKKGTQGNQHYEYSHTI